MHIELNDGRRLEYEEYGDPNGKPLFYFHGWPSSRFSGSEMDETGKKLKVRIISPDRPGFGKSTFKSNRTLLDWPDDVTELADKLKIRNFAVVGISGGGPYSAVCGYKIPERINKVGIVVGLSPIVNRKVLEGLSALGKVSWGNYHRFPFTRTLSAFGGMIQFKYFPFLGRFSFRAKEDQKMLDQTKIKGDTKKKTVEAFRQGYKGPELDLKIYTDDYGFKLSDMKVQTYLWYGAKDKNVTLNMGRYYKSEIKGSKLFIDQKGGHLSRYNYEEKILKALTS